MLLIAKSVAYPLRHMLYCHSEACNPLDWKGKLRIHGYRSTHILLPWLQLFSNCIAIVTNVLSPTGITQSKATAADMVRTTAVILTAFQLCCCTVCLHSSSLLFFSLYLQNTTGHYLPLVCIPENWGRQDCVKPGGPIYSTQEQHNEREECTQRAFLLNKTLYTFRIHKNPS